MYWNLPLLARVNPSSRLVKQDTTAMPDNQPVIPGVIEKWVAPGQLLPLIVYPDEQRIDLLGLATRHRERIRQRLSFHGGILFRGFHDVTLDTFRRLIEVLSGEPLKYQERSSPRHEIKDYIYTSTDYPSKRSILLHNEQSYNVTWPMRIFFHCLVPAQSGGATPLADCRRVYQRISEQTRLKFESGYCYARHFGSGLGLTWEEAFQTERRDEVEDYCRLNDICFSWEADGALSTRQVRPVIELHPETGEATWFNHLTFFNIATLDQATAEALLSFGKEQLPNNTYYADGADIEPSVLAELRAAYDAETVKFEWREGDILMLDNMLVAHGREPFTPPREVAVGMAEPYSRSQRA
jgi:alpha-ketoglutarate-dependent taurine dioxygenase